MENLLVTMIIFILLFKSKKKGEFQKWVEKIVKHCCIDATKINNKRE